MAFKGDSSQISLSNIFQTLQLNRQEGVMTVTNGKIRRKLRVTPSGVRLLAPNRDNLDVLRQAMVKQKIVTEAQFQNIISTMSGPSTFPGEFLIQRRILTRAQAESGIAQRFEELIYEVLSWKKAKYEFQSGDPGDELELFDPQGIGTSLTFNISTLLMEAARRDDEWQRLLAQVPSDREIYAPVKPAGLVEVPPGGAKVPEETLAEVRSLLDGKHSIEAIVAESTLGSFEVFQAIAHLSARNEIRPLSLKEKRELAEELRKKFKTREVVEIYRNILAAEPEDLEIRLRLVGLLEKAKEESSSEVIDKRAPGILVEEYQRLAEHYYAAGEHSASLGYLRKILEIDPYHLLALEHFFDIQYLSKDHREAVGTAKRIVEAVKARKEFERGSEILLKVVDLYPTETFLFHELADMLIFANQSENAVLCLKSVATVYEEKGDLTRLRKTYERIASIDPSQSGALRKIVDAERRAVQPVRSRFALSRRLVWVSAAAAAAMGATWYAGIELIARRAYALVSRDVDAMVEREDYRQAQAALEELGRKASSPLLRAPIDRWLGQIATRERERTAVRRKEEEKADLQFGSLLARLESLTSSKRHLEAMALLRETDRDLLGATNRKRLVAIEGDLLKYFAAAEEGRKRAQELVAAGSLEEAHRQLIQLLMNYPSTPSTKGLKIPLQIRTTPPGCKVTLNGESMGVSPLAIAYDPLGRFSLSITRDGYRPLAFGEEGPERRFDFTKEWSLTLRLERLPAWSFDARAPIESASLSVGSRIYVGTRAGHLICLDRASGVQIWSHQVPDGWAVAGGIQSFQDRICFGTFDGQFHILDSESGKELHRLVPHSPPKPIRHRASDPTARGTLAINCGGAAVVALSAATGAVLWTHRCESEALGPPQLVEGGFLSAMADGSVLTLDAQTGAPVRRTALGQRLSAAGLAFEGDYLFGDSQGKIRRVNLETGEARWTYQSPMETLAPPAVGGELAFLGSQDGFFIALELRTGDLKWRGKVNDSITLPAVWRGGNFYLTTRGGQAICLEGASGSPLWSISPGAACAAPPSVAGGLVLVGFEDGKLIAFQEE